MTDQHRYFHQMIKPHSLSQHKQHWNGGYFSLSMIFILFLSFSVNSITLIHCESIDTSSVSTKDLDRDNQISFQDSIPSIPLSEQMIKDSLSSYSGFTENRGQHPDPELFYYFTQNMYALGFYESQLRIFTRLRLEDPWEQITITFPGAVPCVPRGIKPLPTNINYLNYNRQITGVVQWAEIHFENLYPGITLRFYCDKNTLKYDFIVSPFIDPSIIQLDINGSLPIDIEISPTSVVCKSCTTPGLILWNDHSPIAYQSQITVITAKFRQIGIIPVRYGISTENYDLSKPLVIDPVFFVFSTFLGGSDYEEAFDLALDPQGCVYVTGTTSSSDFPTTNAYDLALGNTEDIFVVKLATDGKTLFYSTYIGGSGSDRGNAIAVDPAGCAYLTGYTDSSDFPTMNAYDTTLNGYSDIFVTKLDTNGDTLMYSTYLGGASSDTSNSITLDALGCVYLTGSTSSPNFPMVNPYDAIFHIGNECFITKLATDGRRLVYSTFLGGSSADEGNSIFVDAVGCVYLTGSTSSTDFPTVNAYNTVSNGFWDIFVSKFGPNGNSLLYSTYFGGSNSDFGLKIIVDTAGYIFLTGYTDSSDFPTTHAYDNTSNGNSDAFLAKFDINSSILLYSTYLGGTGMDRAKGMVIDVTNCVYLTGFTRSADFPLVNPYDSVYDGNYTDIFLTKFAANSYVLTYSTYLGGSNYDVGEELAIDTVGYVYLTGYTGFSDFPQMNAYDPSFNGKYDIFVTKLIFDIDGDGMPDLWESAMGLNATDPSDAMADPDGDGLTNYEEFLRGTSLMNKDSDHDGWNDRLDPSPLNPRSPLSTIIVILLSSFCGSGITFISVIQVRKRRKARLRREILMKRPKNIEEAFALLDTLQKFIDFHLKREEFELSIPLYERKEEIYALTHDLIDNIQGLDTLLPSLLEEQQKNQQYIQDVRNRIWTQRYNQLIEDLTAISSDQSASEQKMQKLTELQTLVAYRLKLAQKEGKTSDIQYYTDLLTQYRSTFHLHQLLHDYQQYEAEFTQCSNYIQSQNWTLASQHLAQLQIQLGQFLEKIHIDSDGSSQGHSLLSAAEQLSQQVSRVFEEVRDNLSAQLRGIMVKPIQISEIQVKMHLPEFNKLTIHALRIPLHAKVVILGESSVGKTHLVLNMTGKQYSERQGSTVGVDKFFLPVSLPLEGLDAYDPQVCFWDLGGNWNFRAVNELFLHEAAMILLVFDVTRIDTFHQLQYWLDMVKTTGVDFTRIFVIGNKLDAGGVSISSDLLSDFQQRNQLRPFYYTSAVTGEGVRTVEEDLVGTIDWSLVIRDVDSALLNTLGGWLLARRKTLSITRIAALFDEIQKTLNITDLLLLKKIMYSYAAQEMIQLSRSDMYVILDPVKIGKLIARIISLAAKQNGLLHKDDLRGLSLPPSQLTDLFDYLCLEQVCFSQGSHEWIFPNVIHRESVETALDTWTRQVLQAGTEIRAMQFWGPGDMVFNRITVGITREWGSPQQVSNTVGVWTIGSGKEKTVILLQFVPAPTGGVIRIKVGGARAAMLITELLQLIRHIAQANVSKIVDCTF